MRKLFLLTLLLISASAFAQKVNKLIQEKNVERIIRTLTKDEMMGRSAKASQQIEKASVFLENEFKTIDLQSLDGLKGYRQEFKKDYISEQKIVVLADGIPVSEKDIAVVSEKTEFNSDQGLPVFSISYTADQPDKDQYFFDKAVGFFRDTTSSIVLIDPEFESGFHQLKEMFKNPFVSGKKFNDIFIFGKKSLTSYSVKLVQKIESIKMNNIVGMLKGTGKPGEIVIFSGHYDHIGILNPVAGDSIANGADDDASGTTAVLELARYFKKIGKNNRTLIFAAFTGEELGSYGAKYFSKQLNADKVVAMFNIEMVGKLAKWGANTAFITGFERSDIGTTVQKNIKGTTYQLNPDPYPEQDLFYRSDNATLARLGVPAHTVSTDQIPTDSLYHSVDDEFESIDIKNLTNIIKMIAIGSQSIIDGTDTPARINKSTVR